MSARSLAHTRLYPLQTARVGHSCYRTTPASRRVGQVKPSLLRA